MAVCATAIVGVILAAVLKGNDATSTANLSGRLIPAQERGEIPRMFFDASRAQQGFTVPPDTHVIFMVPSGTRIDRMTFFGGPINDEVRYWGYCFTGHEERNKAQHLTGTELYDGKFFYSKGERDAQRKRPPSADSILGVLEAQKARTPAEPPVSDVSVFKGGETCYVMSAGLLPAGVDDDHDGLNNQYERTLNTNPNSEDSDGDTIPDGKEIFVTKTNPADPDSDHDNVPDNIEDKNQNGLADFAVETSANSADTDHDGLCDGDGWGSGCPEGYTSPIRGEDFNNNGEVDGDESDPKKWDTEGDGISDLQKRWNELQGMKSTN